MTVGDIVWKRPELGAAKRQQSVPPQEARVVYIHPQRRFYSVEFTFTRGGVTRSFRQAYPLRNRITASTGDVRPETLSEKPRHPRGAVDQISKPAEQGGVFPGEKAEAKKAQEIKSAPTTIPPALRATSLCTREARGEAQEIKSALTTIPPALRATSLCTREALGDGGSAKNKNRRTS